MSVGIIGALVIVAEWPGNIDGLSVSSTVNGMSFAIASGLAKEIIRFCEDRSQRIVRLFAQQAHIPQVYFTIRRDQ